jgi:hypothetical protein
MTYRREHALYTCSPVSNRRVRSFLNLLVWVTRQLAQALELPICPCLHHSTSPCRLCSPYRIVHLDFFLVAACWGRGLSTALQCISNCPALGFQETYRIASSNTLLRLRCVSAEHSRYFCALISFATMTACSYWIGAIFFCLSDSLVPSSSLKSSFVPTRIIGTLGAWWSISGYH